MTLYFMQWLAYIVKAFVYYDESGSSLYDGY
jgi:hypothetical protein